MNKILLAVASFLLLAGCAGDPQNGSPVSIEPTVKPEPIYRLISAEEAKVMLDEENTLILVDVRTEAEFDEQHIDGAVLIPDYEIAERAASELADKDALILIYCRTGRRSALAAQALVDLGYTNVYDFGGIVDWPYETIKG